jgi:osmotically-inducible protein OsmY
MPLVYVEGRGRRDGGPPRGPVQLRATGLGFAVLDRGGNPQEEKQMRTFARYLSVAVLSAGLSVAAACSSSNSTGDRVDKALKDANVKNVNVDFDKNANVVHLKGKVDTTYDKDRADQIANSVVGTSGKVMNELSVEGVDEKTADDMDSQIKSRLNDAVKADSTLADDNVDFKVNNGVVTVTGEVKTAQQKERVSELVKSTTGVKDVANELTIKADNDGKNGNRPGARRNRGTSPGGAQK